MKVRLKFRKIRYRLRSLWVGVLWEKSCFYGTGEGMFRELHVWIGIIPFFPVLLTLKWKEKFFNAKETL